MKTTLELPDDLMRGMKIRAATEGKKLKDVIADAIRDSLVSSRGTTFEAPPIVISRSASGFPYIKALSGTQKPAVTAEQFQRLIEESQLEEDLQRAGISL